MYQWLVDLDSLHGRWPELRFRSADHLGDPRRTIKANVETFLALNGVPLRDGSRVLMLTNARALGHVFNPLSVFWCYHGNGQLAAIVAEVRNTYGERHAYVVHPNEHGFAVASKAFHVSPFFPVDGEYELRLAAIGPGKHCRDPAPRRRRGFRGDVSRATRTCDAAGRRPDADPRTADDSSHLGPDPAARHLAVAAWPARTAASGPHPAGRRLTSSASLTDKAEAAVRHR